MLSQRESVCDSVPVRQIDLAPSSVTRGNASSNASLEPIALGALVVEDELHDFVDMKRKLERLEGYQVSVERASSLTEARRIARAHFFEVIFVDFRLGNDSGTRLFEELRQISPNSALVLLSGITQSNVKESALASGAIHCLEKGNLSIPLIETTIQCALHAARLERSLRLALQDLEQALSSRTEILLRLGRDVRRPVKTLFDTAKRTAEEVTTLEPAEIQSRLYALVEQGDAANHALEFSAHYYMVTSCVDDGTVSNESVGELVDIASDVTKRERTLRQIALKKSPRNRALSISCRRAAIIQALASVIGCVQRSLGSSGVLKISIRETNEYAEINILNKGDLTHELASQTGEADWKSRDECELQIVREILSRHRGAVILDREQSAVRSAVIRLPLVASAAFA